MPKRVQRGGAGNEEGPCRGWRMYEDKSKTPQKKTKNQKKKITERIRKKLQRKASKTQQFAL